MAATTTEKKQIRIATRNCGFIDPESIDDYIGVRGYEALAKALAMNVNEVVANRALQLLGHAPGDYAVLSPLAHVNLHQSTNDTYPTALKVAALTLLKELESGTAKLQEAFQAKEAAFAHVVKVGRTELMDAVPMRRTPTVFSGIVLVLALWAVTAPAAGTPITFGLLLVGPYNDKGYSQAQYEGGQYVEAKLPGAKMLYLDKVNPNDRPGVTIPQLVDELAAKGAKCIIAGSDDMTPGALSAQLAAVLFAAAPLILAALGETVSERAGVINLSLDGLLLFAAMMSQGKQRLLLVIYVCGLAFNLLLCATLIPIHPLLGTCLAILLTKAAVAIVTTSYCQATMASKMTLGRASRIEDRTTSEACSKNGRGSGTAG